MGGYQSGSCSGTLRAQCEADGVKRKNNGPIAYRAMSGRLAWRGTGKRRQEGLWVETVSGGGQRFMAAWRKEEENAARHHQEKREANRARKAAVVQGSIESAKRRRLA